MRCVPKTAWTSICLAVAIATLSSNAADETTNYPHQMVFVHLLVRSNSVSLVKAERCPGRLKPKAPDEAAGNLSVQLRSPSGAPVWDGTVHDPLVMHFEYEDPPGSGELKRKMIRVEEAEVTLRVPFMPGARLLEIQALEAPGKPEGPSGNVLKRALGTIELSTNTVPEI